MSPKFKNLSGFRNFQIFGRSHILMFPNHHLCNSIFNKCSHVLNDSILLIENNLFILFECFYLLYFPIKWIKYTRWWLAVWLGLKVFFNELEMGLLHQKMQRHHFEKMKMRLSKTLRLPNTASSLVDWFMII